MKKQTIKIIKMLLGGFTFVGSSAPIIFSVKTTNYKDNSTKYYGDEENNIPTGYIFKSSISYDPDLEQIKYIEPMPPVNYSTNTNVDENGWATFDNTFSEFFINDNVANLFAKYCNANVQDTISLDYFEEMHDAIFKNSKTFNLNLSEFYKNDKYSYETIKALCNPRFAWVLKPSEDAKGQLFINLSNNDLIEIPDFSQIKSFDKQNNTYGVEKLFESGKNNKGYWKGMNLENNHLMYIPFYTLPHLFPKITSNISINHETGIMLDFNYMPYLYHDKRIPSVDVDGNNVLPGRLINNSSIKYTILYSGEVSNITTILEELFKIGIYQLDGFNASELSLHNYLCDLIDQGIFSKNIFNNYASSSCSKYQFGNLRRQQMSEKSEIDEFLNEEENLLFKYVNKYIGDNWLSSQSTIYNSIYKFFQKIADGSSFFRNLTNIYEMPVQIYPNDPFGTLDVRNIPPASKTNYFDHDIIKPENITNGNINDIANDIINAFSFNYASQIVKIRGFSKSPSLMIVYLCSFTLLTLIIAMFLLKATKEQKSKGKFKN